MQAHNFAKQTRIQTIQTDIVPLHPILHTYQISRQNIQPSLFYIFEFVDFFFNFWRLQPPHTRQTLNNLKKNENNARGIGDGDGDLQRSASALELAALYTD